MIAAPSLAPCAIVPQVEETGSTRSEHEASLACARAAASGEKSVQREVLLEVTPTIRAVVVRFLGRAHREQDDCIQDVLVAFLLALPRFRGECSLKHYARRIALRRLLDRQKAQMTEKRTLDNHFGEEPDVAPVSPRQMREVQTGRIRGAFKELLAALPAEQSFAFASRHVLGMSLQEIAQQQEVSTNTVRSRIRLAREALRSAIERDPLAAQVLGRNQ